MNGYPFTRQSGRLPDRHQRKQLDPNDNPAINSAAIAIHYNAILANQQVDQSAPYALMEISNETLAFTDIHCHILPTIDDGAKDWDESLAMAKLAVDNGTRTIIATPHQLGNYCCNSGSAIRTAVTDLQRELTQRQIPLQVLPGADVRIEPSMVSRIQAGDVLSLGDHRRHVLLELPHELYFPLQPVLRDLKRARLVGVLSHPERNQGILAEPDVIPQLVKEGCLMQITASSLCGGFGRASQSLAESMLAEGHVHVIASDGHGARCRRPLLAAAFRRAAEIVGDEAAVQLCCTNPRAISEGSAVVAVSGEKKSRRRWSRWGTAKQVA